MRGDRATVGDPPWELFGIVGVPASGVCVSERLVSYVDQQF
jgi:hypothetical protein